MLYFLLHDGHMCCLHKHIGDTRVKCKYRENNNRYTDCSSGLKGFNSGMQWLHLLMHCSLHALVVHMRRPDSGRGCISLGQIAYFLWVESPSRDTWHGFGMNELVRLRGVQHCLPARRGVINLLALPGAPALQPSLCVQAFLPSRRGSTAFLHPHAGWFQCQAVTSLAITAILSTRGPKISPIHFGCVSRELEEMPAFIYTIY